MCSRPNLGQDFCAQTPFRANLLEHVNALDNSSCPHNVLSSNFIFSLPTQKPHAEEARGSGSVACSIQNTERLQSAQVQKAWHALSNLQISCRNYTKPGITLLVKDLSAECHRDVGRTALLSSCNIDKSRAHVQTHQYINGTNTRNSEAATCSDNLFPLSNVADAGKNLGRQSQVRASMVNSSDARVLDGSLSNNSVHTSQGKDSAKKFVNDLDDDDDDILEAWHALSNLHISCRNYTKPGITLLVKPGITLLVKDVSAEYRCDVGRTALPRSCKIDKSRAHMQTHRYINGTNTRDSEAATCSGNLLPSSNFNVADAGKNLGRQTQVRASMVNSSDARVLDGSLSNNSVHTSQGKDSANFFVNILENIVVDQIVEQYQSSCTPQPSISKLPPITPFIDKDNRQEATSLPPELCSNCSHGFKLPALICQGITLVISPLVSLTQDQIMHLLQANIPAAYLSANMEWTEQQEILRELNYEYCKYKLLYVTPEKVANIWGVDYNGGRSSLEQVGYSVEVDGKILRPKMKVKADPELQQLLRSGKDTNEGKHVYEFFLALAACNTVVPLVVDTSDPNVGLLDYQGESPHEQPLVYAAATYGFMFIERTSCHIVIDIQGDRKSSKDSCRRSLEDAVLMSRKLVMVSADTHTDGGNSGHGGTQVALIIDGTSLVYILDSELEEKAGIVALVKNRTTDMTLAIGDVANDVSMIQMADVGVGISGQEGRQAVMASDFAMGQFRFLVRLLLVHGHWNYQRMGYMILYNFYTNAVCVLFTSFTLTTAITEWSSMLYSIIYTAVPTIDAIPSLAASEYLSPSCLIVHCLLSEG
ncbi:hypothetical protein C1H46_009909 [Malus baccata]|uniref:P-type ATPase C-terminal domain-containing protein n=1 Tax=Malus baccata TaxID=106549 RepID=A0A540N1T4_MALBA|nr:hypothetical protein C1H46_009909 [Malus baccata]